MDIEERKTNILIKQVVSNSVLTTMALIISRMINVIAFLIITYQLGERQAGIFAMALNYSLFFAQLAFWGLDQILARDIFSDKNIEREILGFFLIIRSTATFGIIIIYLFFVNFIQKNPIYLLNILNIAGINIFTESLLRFSFNIYNSFGKSKYTVYVSIFSGITKIFFITVIYFTNIQIEFILWSIIISNLLSLFVSFYFIIIKFPIPKFSQFPRFFVYYFSSGILFIAISTANAFEMQFDTILLTQLIVDKKNVVINIGSYNAITVILYSLLIIIQSIRSSLFPVMNKIYSTNRDFIYDDFEKIVCSLLAFILPIILTIMWFAEYIIHTLYMGKFSEIVTGLRVIIWSSLFTTMILPTNIMIIIKKKNILLFNMQLSATISNILINIILIPRLDYMGAVWARFSSNLLLFFFNYILFLTMLNKKIFFLRVLKIIICNIFMMFIFFLTNKIFNQWIISAILGITMNYLLITKINLFNKGDLSLITIFRRTNSSLDSPDLH